MAGLSSISGLVAGFDTKAAVGELLGFRKFEISQLTKKQDAETAKQTALSDLNTLVADFRTLSTSMKDVDTFFNYTASLNSSNATVPASSLLDVTGDNSVTAGSHSMVVNQLATGQRLSSNAAVKDFSGTVIANDTTALSLTGSFTLNGTNISITAADSLKDIVNNINGKSTGVTASVIKVSDGDYRLILASDTTGQTGFSLIGADLNSSVALGNLQLGSLASSAAVVDVNTGVAATSDTTALGVSGTFQINGSSVTLATGDSLQAIAANITTNVAGVTAAVQTVGTSDFRLILMEDGANPIANHTITITGTPPTQLNLSGSVSNALSSLQQAQDSKVTIDGLAISRSSNTISDALTGLTLTLKQADATTTVNMSIGVDTVGVQSKAQSFVDAYNAVATFVNDQFVVNADTGANGVLAGEPILTSIQSMLTSSLLQNVTGLASDRNTLVEIGIEPDQKGQISINATLFDKFLNNDPKAIRDLFVAQGSSTVSGLQFLVSGNNTVSGTYAVNLVTAAARANITGAAPTNLVTTGIAASEIVTITESGSNRQAVITLAANAKQGDIISALNTEFAKETTEKRLFDVALLSGAVAANGGTAFSAIDGANVLAGDVITISGTNRSGVAINGSFSILDPATDTLSSLLSAIQSTFNQQVVASIDAAGQIQITDNSVGDSKLSVALSSNNTGSGLNFGVDTTTATTQGRFALSVEAIVSGNNITMQHRNYGGNSGFTISESVNGLGFGITAQTLTGTSISGTINGETATGSGQVLVGTAGSVDGIGLLYSGISTGAIGNLTIGMGVAASFDGTLDLFSNPFSGFIQNTITASQDTATTLTQRIADLNIQMEKQRVTLTQAFARMEASLNTLNGTGSFLTQQIDAQNASRR